MSDEVYVPLSVYEETLKQLADYRACFYVAIFILGMTIMLLYFVFSRYVKLKKGEKE